MKKKLSLFIVATLCLGFLPLMAQDSLVIEGDLMPVDTISEAGNAEQLMPNVSLEIEPVKTVKYQPGFEFNDGIYANFDMVKDNNPIPPARIVSDHDMFDRAFYEKVTGEKEIVMYDENGVKKVMETANIWGYGRNGVLHINIAQAFHRISFVGSISHFVASITTYSPNYYDPYYYNPYSPYSYGYNRYTTPQSNYASTDLRQYLLNFESGEVLEYTTESVEVLLMGDPELYDEFQSLRNRKKKQMKFVFIRRYNEKHPLYLPVRDNTL